MTGTLQIKGDKYYAVLNIYENGKRKRKWINSGLSVKGNKTRAEKFLREQITIFEQNEGIFSSDILFSDFVGIWLSRVRSKVDVVTYEGYEQLAKTHIIPYFSDKKIKLCDISKDNLQKYIDEKYQYGRIDKKGGLAARSLILHMNIINQTLEFALSEKMIANNPKAWVELPTVEKRDLSFFSAIQVDILLKAITDDPLYTLIKITVFYGLRRSEVLGLKWSMVDFTNDTIRIAHTVVKINSIVRKDKTKNSSSKRTYPMIDNMKELLLTLKRRQLMNQKLFGKEYYESDYIFVWDDGRPYRPDYVTHRFSRILELNNLPHIRFHDLRHSCASVLLSKGFSLKDVQEWLGHSDIKMTANVYGHLDIERKKHIAEGINTIFS